MREREREREKEREREREISGLQIFGSGRPSFGELKRLTAVVFLCHN